MDELENITKEEVIYDLKRHYKHAEDVYKGYLKPTGLTREGAFRRMQVYKFAIDNLNKQ